MPDLAISFPVFAGFAACLAMGAFLRGLAGFGMALVAMPFLVILVPPAVGIMAYGSEILADATAILLTLGASLALSLPFCGWLMQKMIERQDRRAGQ